MANQNETVISVQNNEEPPQKTSINILFIDLTHYSQLKQFIVCTIFVFLCYLVYGYYIEVIFSNPEVRPVSLYITLIQFLYTSLLSYSESRIRNRIKRKVPLRTYCVLAALTIGTMALSNLSLSYLNYPTQLIFKSCKLLPVMIGSIVIMGKSYSFLDYVTAITMCIGLTMFTLADSLTSPKFNLVGVLIISQALVCDAVIGNLQEKAMKEFKATTNEVMCYSYAIGSLYLFSMTVITGILTEGFSYCAKDPLYMYGNIFMLSFSGYVGLQAVLSLVQIVGATVAVTVTTMRKAISICLSFLLFSKPFVFQYLWSGLLIVLAIYLNHYSKKNPGYIPGPIRRIIILVAKLMKNQSTLTRNNDDYGHYIYQDIDQENARTLLEKKYSV